MRLAAALTLTLALALPAAAQTDVAAQAEQASQALKAAIEGLNKANGARDRVKALTRTIQAYEAGLAAMRSGLRSVTIREASISAALTAERGRISALLGVLTSVERTPAPLLLLHPMGPLGAVRSAMIVQDVTPELQHKAEILRGQLQELAKLRAIQQASTDTLKEGLGAVQKARTDLSEAASNRTDLPKRLTRDPEELQRIAANAKTLHDFAKFLAERDLGPGPSVPPFTEAKGKLPMPVDGTILRHAGQPDAAGIKRPGIVIATAPRALVTAPWPSTIRYVGPLLDYGNVIVLEPGDGYLLVLAGLDEVYGKVGQVIDAGDPVGLMGGNEAGSGQSAQEGGGVERPETLYMELSKGDTPVNPETWLAKTRR